MTTFVTIHKPTDDSLGRESNDNIVDWSEYRGTKAFCDLANEMQLKWPANYIVYELYDGAKGGGAGTTVGGLWEHARKNIGSKTYHYKPHFKGLAILGGFTDSPYQKLSEDPVRFKKYTHYDLDSEEAKQLLQPIPMLSLESRQHFGCRRNRQSRQEAIENIIKLMGPNPIFDLSELRIRIFGYKYKERFQGERPFWTLYIFERDEQENLKGDKVDFWELLKKHYKTEDLNEMRTIEGLNG